MAGSLGDSDADGHKYLIDFGNDPCTGDWNITPVGGECSVMAKCIVHDDLHCSNGNLIDTGCHSQRKNGRQIACLRNQHGVVQVHFPESGKIKDDQKSGYDLADHGCQAAPLMPQPNPKMKSGSRMVLMAAPARMQAME